MVIARFIPLVSRASARGMLSRSVSQARVFQATVPTTASWLSAPVRQFGLTWGSVARYSTDGENNGNGRENTPTTRSIYVGNIPWRCEEKQITDLFESFGEVFRIHVPKDDMGRMRGIAFVDMVDQEAAEKAIGQLNGYNFLGRDLRVSFSLHERRYNPMQRRNAAFGEGTRPYRQNSSGMSRGSGENDVAGRQAQRGDGPATRYGLFDAIDSANDDNSSASRSESTDTFDETEPMPNSKQ
ncbi:hypothetical protein IWQ62_004519 [Dispira parvispora]|uniref:RRM domain-containing protein n=1 Tax=Dispira parvispora TaxID=1520584 RepID=A0A9W8E5C2_9FUNG|nr:hypothetical protein IWQ62_004519 [Dispira parvispora]